MKSFFFKIHYKIDIFAVSLFLYAVLVLLFLEVTFFITNEKVRAIVVLIIPLLIIKPRIVKSINELLHRIFGFTR